MNRLEMKVISYTPLFKTLLWLPAHSKYKPKSLQWPPSPCVSWPCDLSDFLWQLSSFSSLSSTLIPNSNSGPLLQCSFCLDFSSSRYLLVLRVHVAMSSSQWSLTMCLWQQTLSSTSCSPFLLPCSRCPLHGHHLWTYHMIRVFIMCIVGCPFPSPLGCPVDMSN